MTEEALATFLRPMGFAIGNGEGVTGGVALVSPELWIPGTQRIRSSVLGCWADMVAGSEVNSLSQRQVAVTVDLTIRLLAPPVAERVVIASNVLKAGRNTTFCEVRMTNEHGVTFAASHMTFQLSPRPQDVQTSGTTSSPGPRTEAVAPSYPAPFFEFMGLRRLGHGVSELDRVPSVMNPVGTIQGGAVAAMVEAAAEDLQGQVGDMELHYLKAVRVGPGRATAERLGDHGPIRVDLRDPGSGGRLCTLGLAWPALPPHQGA